MTEGDKKDNKMLNTYMDVVNLYKKWYINYKLERKISIIDFLYSKLLYFWYILYYLNILFSTYILLTLFYFMYSKNKIYKI